MKLKKKTSNKQKFSFVGYLLFFITIAVTVTLAVLIYSYVEESSGGNIKLISIIMLFVIFVLSAICTIIDVARRKLKVEIPVNKILKQTEQIMRGNFEIQLLPMHAYKNYDQYDIIIENLNKMTAELSKTEMLRTDFICNVSHEIKTPLAIIQNYASALQNEKLDASTRHAYAETLICAAKRLSDLVVNILKLNKLENQEIAPEVEEVFLGEILRQAVLQQEELLDGKNIILNCQIEDITICSSANLLEIVFNNLLSNAIKFTPSGGVIGVVCTQQDGQAVVEISDTGCGISAEVGRHIFDKFYQGDTSHASEGNGLGLAMVKKVMDLLGGKISVASVIDKGSTFTIKLKQKTI